MSGPVQKIDDHLFQLIPTIAINLVNAHAKLLTELLHNHFHSGDRLLGARK